MLREHYAMAVPLSVTAANNTVSPSGKRRRLDECDNQYQLDGFQHHNNNGMISGHMHFFPIRRSNSVFHTDDCLTTGTALFKPLYEDLLINSLKHEQISCGEGDYFVADDKGNYSHTVAGRVLHLWKYDKQEKKLYIARSFLFTTLQEYMEVHQYLQKL